MQVCAAWFAAGHAASLIDALSASWHTLQSASDEKVKSPCKTGAFSSFAAVGSDDACGAHPYAQNATSAIAATRSAKAEALVFVVVVRSMDVPSSE